MKVRELKNFLELQMGESKISPLLKSYSHWMKMVLEAKEFVTSNPRDIATLHRLAELKVVSLSQEKGQTVATLTQSGKELYQDFYGHGYFL